MAKFIEIHLKGKAVLLNLDRVLEVHNDENGKCEIAACVDDCFYKTDESYEKVRQMIASAQGGIPMDKSKMY